MPRPLLVAMAAALCPFTAIAFGPVADVLQAVDAAPAHVANRFADDATVVMTSAGEYVALDRRSHAVYVFDRTGTIVRRIAGPGPAAGEILDPLAIALNTNDLIAVADSPNGYDRIQYFGADGLRVGGFYLPLPPSSRLTIANVLVAGGTALGFSGSRFIVSRPDWGALVTELDTSGRVVRQMGSLRATGHAPDRALELAMNVGIPLAEPDGGFYFVFQTGVPILRKYAPDGTLVFERHIEGPELDARIQALPTTWPPRPAANHPVVPPMVRAAAVDRAGGLWIALYVPYTYVYDRRGEKVRTVQFRGASLLSPSSLFFTADGRLIAGPRGYAFDVR